MPRLALALLALTIPSLASAEQFVLFDVTFTFTKEDADNSKPSKSHYYVKGEMLNPDRPRTGRPRSTTATAPSTSAPR